MDQLHCPAESTANASSNDKDSPTATPLCEATSQSRWCSGSLEDLWGTKCAVDEAFLAEPVEQRSAELVRLYCPLGQLPTLLSIWPGDLDVIAVVFRLVAWVDDMSVDDHVADTHSDIRHEYQHGHTHQQRNAPECHAPPSRDDELARKLYNTFIQKFPSA